MTFRPHWVNGWGVRRFADPFVDLDGQVVRASWAANQSPFLPSRSS